MVVLVLEKYQMHGEHTHKTLQMPFCEREVGISPQCEECSTYGKNNGLYSWYAVTFKVPDEDIIWVTL